MSYPPNRQDVKEESRNFQDEAAAQMYRDAGGPALAKAAGTMTNALIKQAEKLEEFHSTPFTKQNIKTIETTLEGLERIQRALEEWHWLIYPNQRPVRRAE